ncbi:sulfatase [Novosphingobium sp. 1949]|uniref:Sulfatase n=1 Tax=Novosphingobium organovorum TaxID=2930092 RepID=A0ABT0BHY0_9SPHN|nr:sulfatase [Novosphingobium organovorum]MCJ2184334.1 sulfatase [Novosphingobium organovorum]
MPTDRRGAPNLLLITADDIDWTGLGFMTGRSALTPNLDRLAARSQVFEQVRTVAPICMPSRQAFMSGKLPHRNGGNGFFPMVEGTPTLCSTLDQAGYYCAASHKIGHMQPASSFPWRNAAEGKDRHPLVHAAFLSLAITEAQAQLRPFFVNCNINDPHRPFYGSPVGLAMDNGNQGPYKVPHELGAGDVTVPPNLDDLPAVSTEHAQYWNSVQRLDIAVGHILDTLEASGEADNTVVLFVADHGMPLPFAKATCYDHGIRTPVILRYPGMGAPRRHDTLTTNLDILPTLCELLGQSAPEGIDGASWVPMLRDGAAFERAYVTSYVDYVSSGMHYPMRSLQDRRWALLVTPWADGGKTLFRAEAMFGLTWPAMVERAKSDPAMAERVAQYTQGYPFALYDLEHDPGQRHNLIDAPEHRARAARMKQLLLDEMVRTGDPQLDNYRRMLAGQPAQVAQNPERYRLKSDD